MFRMRLAALTLAGAIATAAGGAAQVGQPAGIERLTWLQGCWEAATAQRTVEEQWMSPRGKSMISAGRTVRGDSLVEYELVVIREKDAQLAYEAHPSGQPSAVFLSRSISGSEVLFENPQHDFPQRIGYRRDSPDALLAWIEGTRNGQTSRIEFPYQRVACPGT